MASVALSSTAQLLKIDFTKTETVDNLWDGVNRAGQIQVFNKNQHVLVDGSSESPQRFGASPLVGDVTGDGQPELVVGDARGFVWLYTLGPPARSRKVSKGTFIPTYFGDCLTIGLTDWNNDKLLDLICGDIAGGVMWCKNLGGGQFTTDDAVPVYYQEPDKSKAFPQIMMGRDPLSVGNFSAPIAYDLTRNGRVDLIVGDGSYSANSVYLFRNTGGVGVPLFSAAERYWLAYGSGREQLVPALGDLDGDGDPDLVVGDRIGNVHLYVNEPLESSDKKERFLMTYKGMIGFDGNDVPLGPLVRPELVDWDGDGDLDLLLGANDGRIYFAENTGSKTAHQFATPVPLVSPDVDGPYQIPQGWTIDFIWYQVATRWNSGAYLKMERETSETGAVTEFVRYSYYNDYVGYPQRIMCGVSVPYPVGKHVMYITCRARNYNRIGVEMMHHELARKGRSDTMQEAWPILRFDIKPSSDWQELRHEFDVQPEFEESKGVLTTINKDLRFLVEGRKGLEFDIREIRIE